MSLFPGRASRSPGYGQGEHTIDDDAFLDPTELLDELRALFASPNYHPPLLPAVALDVHALTKRADSSIADVVRLVRRDAMLAADVLRRAQSPAFVTKNAPRTLEDAAQRLGMRGIRDLVFEVAMTGKVFRSDVLEGPMDELRRHSTRVAMVAREVALETAISDDSVFLAALLHDVGLVAALHALADWKKKGRRFELADARSALTEIHVAAGTALVRLWGLPDELGWVVGAHHDPTIQGYVHPVAACIVVAEEVCSFVFGDLQLAGEFLEGTGPHVRGIAQKSLGLDDKTIARLVERVKLRGDA
jgi:HD-like signal output (HDOD) protein